MSRQTAETFIAMRTHPGLSAGVGSRPGLFVAAALAVVSLAGCAHPYADVIRPIPAGAPIALPNPDLASVVLPHGTAKGDCGPEALCAVMTFWGDDCPVKTASRALYNASLQGTVSMDLVPFARGRGFEAEFAEGTLDSLRRDTEAGRPVVVMVDVALLPFAHQKSSPISGWFHFFPVVGIDPQTGDVLCAHYEGARLAIKADAFDVAWKACGRFAVALRPGPELALRILEKEQSPAAVSTGFDTGASD